MILVGLTTWNTCTYVHNTNPSISTSTIPPFPSFRRLVTNKAVRNNDRPTGSYPFIGLFVCDCRVLTVTIPLCASSLTRHYPSSDSDWVEREPLFLLLQQASSVSCISLFASRILRSRLLDFVVGLLTVGWYLNGTLLVVLLMWWTKTCCLSTAFNKQLILIHCAYMLRNLCTIHDFVKKYKP